MTPAKTVQYIGILAYGSLIHPEEFSRKGIVSAVPVRISGFRRLFNQKPTWRKGEGSRIGVLNVEYASAHSINAVCLSFETEHYEALFERESGYTLQPVDAERIACYPGYELPEQITCYLFIGEAQMQREDILPNRAYLEICLAGAERWGERFLEEFITTTYLADGTELSKHLSEETDTAVKPKSP